MLMPPRAGNTLYIAGKIAKDAEGNVVGKGDYVIYRSKSDPNPRTVLRIPNCFRATARDAWLLLMTGFAKSSSSI